MSSIFEQSINRIALRVPRRSFATGLISLACRDEATTHANKRQISPVRANEDRNNYRSLKGRGAEAFKDQINSVRRAENVTPTSNTDQSEGVNSNTLPLRTKYAIM
jgi:hypothetical protein